MRMFSNSDKKKANENVFKLRQNSVAVWDFCFTSLGSLHSSPGCTAVFYHNKISVISVVVDILEIGVHTHPTMGQHPYNLRACSCVHSSSSSYLNFYWTGTSGTSFPAAQWLSFGCEGWKTLSAGHCFFSIFNNARKNNGQAFSGTFAPRLNNSYSHAHTQGQQMWPSQGPFPYSKYSITVEERCSC